MIVERHAQATAAAVMVLTPRAILVRMNWLRHFRHNPSSPVAPQIVVTLYTRAGCHLCELAAKPTMRAVAATRGAVFRAVDIDTDAALTDHYGLRIPVVTAMVEGQERVVAEGKVSDVRLQRALAALRTET